MGKPSARHPKRQQKRTIFIIGEGEHEYNFFLHLKHIYHSREADFNIECAKAKGGSPLAVAQKAKRITDEKPFTKKFILIDTDIPISQEYYDFCKSHNFETLNAIKCFSCVLAQISELKFNHATIGCTSTNSCKSVVFKYLKEHEPTNGKTLLNYFPQEQIEKKKLSITLLAQLVNIFSIGIK